MSKQHPLDAAIALTAGPTDNGFSGQITAAYANMVGPYGGVIAAALLNAVQQHVDSRGTPLSITVNYAAPITASSFDITATLQRNNRSSQHWSLALSQAGEVATTATVIMASRRETWSDTEAPAPDVRAAESLPRLPPQGMPAWVSSYDMRIIKGMVTLQEAHQTDDSTSLLWVRDEPPRPLDYVSLLAISDCFFPRIFVRRQQLVPTGTITLTTYFHVGVDALQRQGDKPLLARARANRFHKGFFDQSACLWGEAGELLATSHQLVYYKG